jgi:hypothetical protein
MSDADLRSETKMGRPPIPIDIEEVMTFANEGMTLRGAADLLGVGVNTLRHHLERTGRLREYGQRQRFAVTPTIKPPHGPVTDPIILVIGTFRRDAKIIIDDVRFAAAVDGIDMSMYSASKITNLLRVRCDTLEEHSSDGKAYWVRRW